ncbi:hypothetical protein [Halostella sp. PRR32]|uniref:hypothetical protein n=1 Tax=Halostella sp. PRR32 TaxID=3098147 RepID=UPI002B1D0806|nr:hypothetical protein [Halostella sp. PRR32]
MRVKALVVVLLLLVSGCSAPFLGDTTTDAETEVLNESTVDATTTDAPMTETTTTTDTLGGDEYDVTVQNGTLGVDEDKAYGRTQSLLGTDIEPRPVEVRNLTERRGFAPGANDFFATMGVGNASFDEDTAGGLTTTSGAVYIHPGNGSPGEVEQVLVHEYVHAAQFNGNMLPWIDALEQPRLTNDLVQTRLSLVEGGAVYVSDVYTDQHLDVAPSSTRIADEYDSGSTAERLFLARYHFGNQYVANEIDDPSELETVYEDYPRTTEQLLHPGSDDVERNLNVAVDDAGEWRTAGNDTIGELTTRVLLSGELDDDTASQAAAGWGTDDVVILRNDDQRAYIWAFRMDDTSEADELAAAMETFADARNADSDAMFAVDRPTGETVVLTAAPDSFDAAVEGENGSVTVTVE